MNRASRARADEISWNTFRAIKVVYLPEFVGRWVGLNATDVISEAPVSRDRRQSRSYFALLRTVIPLLSDESLPLQKRKRSFVARSKRALWVEGNPLWQSTLNFLYLSLSLSLSLSSSLSFGLAWARSIRESRVQPEATRGRTARRRMASFRFHGHIPLRKFRFSRSTLFTLKLAHFQSNTSSFLQSPLIVMATILRLLLFSGSVR